MAQKEPVKNFVLHDRHGNEIDFSSLSVVGEVEVILGTNIGEPTANSSYQGGKLTIELDNIKGDGITNIEQTPSTEDGGINVVTITCDSGTIYTLQILNGTRGNGITAIETEESQEDGGTNTVTFKTTDNPEGQQFHVKNGHRGNGIVSVTEEVSQEDGGINTIVFTDDNGQTHTIHTRNGQTGRPGADRQPVESGDVIIAHGLGTDETKVMSQMGVSNALAVGNKEEIVIPDFEVGTITADGANYATNTAIRTPSASIFSANGYITAKANLAEWKKIISSISDVEIMLCCWGENNNWLGRTTAISIADKSEVIKPYAGTQYIRIVISTGKNNTNYISSFNTKKSDLLSVILGFEGMSQMDKRVKNVEDALTFDDIPTAGSTNLVKSKNISKVLANNFILGKGQTASEAYFDYFIPERIYKIAFKDADWDKTGVSQYSIFLIDSLDGSDNATSLVSVSYGNAVSPFYLFKVPANSAKLKIAGRAAVGEEVMYSIIDVTEDEYVCSLFKPTGAGLTFPCIKTIKANKWYRVVCDTSESATFRLFGAKPGSGYAVGKDTKGNIISNMASPVTLNGGEYLVMFGSDVAGIRITDNTSSVKVDVFEASQAIVEAAAVKPLDKIFPELLPGYVSPSSADVLYTYLNGAYAENEFNNIFNFSDGRTSHDSTLIIVGGYAYVLYSYDNSGSDNASSQTCQVRLKKVNLANTSDNTTYVIAKKDDVHGAYTQTGGAGSPTMKNVDGVLHIIYAANVDSVYVEMHTTFDTSTSEIGAYEKLSLTKDSVSGVLNNTLLGQMFGNGKPDGTFNQMQMNCTIGVNDGYYYGGLVYGNGDGNALVIKTDDFVNWTFVTLVDFGCKAAYELACWCKGGYLYVAKRLPYPVKDTGGTNGNLSGNNMTLGPLAKYDIANGKWASAVAVKNCCTRPAFFEFDGSLYLITSGPARSDGQIILINEYRLDNSKIVMELDNAICQYPSIYGYNGELYMIGTSGYTIPLYKLALDRYTSSEIKERLLSIME